MLSTRCSINSRFAILLKVVAVVLPTTMWNIVGMLPRIWLQKLPLKASLWNAVVRSMMRHMPPQSLQAMFPSTLDTYKTWIRREGSMRGFRERIQPTDACKTNILWLEKEEKYEKVLLFFHGGGYILPLSDGHLEWMAFTQECLAAQDIHVRVAVMEYALAPTHPYPAQLSQAIDALQTLINAGFVMEDIVIGGDSAGAHLTLSLLSHLNHPRMPHLWPESAIGSEFAVETPEILVAGGSARLPAAFMVSPLCSLDTTWTSYMVRSSADVLCTAIVRDYGKYHLDGSSAQNEKDFGLGWSMPLDMSTEAVAAWWQGLGTVVTNVLITVGQEEVFRDPCIKFAEVLRGAERKVTGFEVKLLLSQEEAHDAPLFDFAAGRPPSSTTKVINQFVFDAFRNHA